MNSVRQFNKSDSGEHRFLIPGEGERSFEQLPNCLASALSRDDDTGVQDQTHRSVPAGGQPLLAALNNLFDIHAKFSQPTRAQLVAARGQTDGVPPVTAFPSQHYNAIASWSVAPNVEVKHVYA